MLYMENKKDVQTLIQIAKKKLKTPIKRRTTHRSELEQVRLFIEETNLKPHSSIHIPGFIIYDKYVKWCEIHNTKPTSKQFFFNKFKLYFNSKIFNSVRNYYVSPEGFDLSFQNLEFVKNEEKKNKKKR